MEAKIVKMPDRQGWISRDLLEYRLIAYPDSSTREKIQAEKKTFEHSFQQEGNDTLPHLLIAGFYAKEAMEETIIRYTQRICSSQAAFSVALNNYGGQPPHTIHLRVQNHEPFRQLAEQLQVIARYVESCSCPPVQLITRPSVPIAQHLPQHMYFKALLQASQQSFYETFMVNELVLLRQNSPYSSSKPVQIFQLQPPGFNPPAINITDYDKIFRS